MAASFVEERLFKWILENAKDGRVVEKIDTIAEELGESRTPIYKALASLQKKRKIKTESRGRRGMEIVIPEQLKGEMGNDTSCENEIENKKNGEGSPKNLESVLGVIKELSLEQLHLVKDYIDLYIMRKKEEK